MTQLRVFILAASSDIGAHLADRYLRAGAEVVGTYRSSSPRVAELAAAGAKMFPLDITSGPQVKALAATLKEDGFTWDVMVSAAGVLDPIGKFFATNFDAWEASVIANSTGQLRVLHAIHPLRGDNLPAKVMFFAGGGTNGPFDNYSAYCLGKLLLIKMAELLDSECPDLQVSILGTGWVNTKIHRQTLAAGADAGKNLERTREFLDGGDARGSSLDTVADCIDWCLASPRSAVGGRNFSLVSDPWGSAKLVDDLNANRDMYKLRRFS